MIEILIDAGRMTCVIMGLVYITKALFMTIMRPEEDTSPRYVLTALGFLIADLILQHIHSVLRKLS